MQETVLIHEDGTYDSTPTYLFDHSDLYNTDPHGAGLTWFNEAHYGLGISFGLYSMLGHGIDSMSVDGLDIETYAGIKERFKAEHFDALDIVHFAIANGMRYVDVNVCAPDGFCLWNSAMTDFNSTRTPARRDLLGELASVCEYEGIGLCLTYSHGLNWRHPGAPETRVKSDKTAIDEFLDYTGNQIKELLTQYGPIAAINLEGLDAAGQIASDTLCIDDLYKMIHVLQPQTLVSYQHGLSGEEDFFTVRSEIPAENSEGQNSGFIHKQKNKMIQVRESLTPGFWGYNPEYAGQHYREEFIWNCLDKAGRKQFNFMVGTCLMPDGSLDLEDINSLLEVGKRIEQGGFPSAL